MLSKKFKILALGASMLLGGTACQHKENNGKDAESNPVCVKYNRITQVYDSILNAKGMPTINPYAYKVMELTDSVAKMEWQNSVGFAIDSEVKKSIAPIVDSCVAKVCGVLNEYHIKYDDEMMVAVRNDIIESNCFLAKDAGNWYIIDNIESFVDGDKLNGYSNYRKNEIKKIIRNILLVDMCQENTKVRKSIEAKYAKYIPGGTKTIDEMVFDEVDDTPCIDYANLNWCVGGTRVKYRIVNVYAPDERIKFFGDFDAMYKLNKIADGKWIVVKTFPNGKIVKTDTILDDSDFEVEEAVVNPKRGVEDIEYYTLTASTNADGGVNIKAVERLKREGAIARFPRSRALDKNIKQTTKTLNEYRKLSQEYIDAADSVYQIATQIADKQK